MPINDYIARWTMDDTSGTTCVDSTGSYNGTYANSPTLNQTGAFGASKAVTFASASSQRVSATNPVTAYPFTVACWAKPASLTAQTNVIELRTALGWVRIEQRTDGSARIIRYDGTSNNFTLAVAGVFVVGVWSHVTLVCNSSTEAALYINGGGPTSVSVAVNYTGATSVTLAGSTAGNYFSGTLDDVRIYSRALSAADVSELFRYGADITTGLTAHWKLDETSGTVAADSSGNGYTGTYTNSPTLGAAGAFGASKAVTFDGSNDYVALPTNIGSGATAVTIAFWAKVTDLAAQRSMVSLNYSYPTSGILVRSSGSGGTYSVFTDSGSEAEAVSATAIPLTEWAHVAVTCDGTTKIYINGVLDKTTTSRPFAMGSGISSYIGVRTPGAALMKGTLDDVRIYNRALSAGEVLELFLSHPINVRSGVTVSGGLGLGLSLAV